MSILRTIRYLAILGIVLFSFGCSEGEASQQRREPNLVEPILDTHRANLATRFYQEKVEWSDPTTITEKGISVQHSLFPTTPPKPDEVKTFRTSEADERYIVIHLRYGDKWVGQVYGLKYSSFQQYAAHSEESLKDGIQSDFRFSSEVIPLEIE